MNIEKLQLSNFKRFTDLEIDLSECDGAPKLVLLIGSNGCGKSSVFDALEYVSGRLKNFEAPHSADYLEKVQENDLRVVCELGGGDRLWRTKKKFSKRGNSLGSGSFYGRSSLRTVPELKSDRSMSAHYDEDSDRPRRFIEFDRRFEADIAQITEKILHELWGESFDADALKSRFLNPINDALDRIFAHSGRSIRLTQLIPALESKPPNIRFRKGESEIHYDLLSSGEKEVFNIILNLFNRREHFQNAIYFIDELDVHLNTKLQYGLLKEVVENWIPDDSQLWTATHSLGFIEYAAESDEAVIIDFDDLDFDEPQKLGPAPKSEDIFEIAVPQDSALKVFPNRKLVLCENQNVALYNVIDLPEHLFVAARDKNAVSLQTKAHPEFFGLMDRDFLGTAEIEEIRKQHGNLFVLLFYSIESYLYHPSNLAELGIEGFDSAEYSKAIFGVKESLKSRILLRLQKTRDSYEIVKSFSKALKSEAEEEIAAALESVDPDVYYPFVDMKRYRPTSILARFNLNPRRLAETKWMRDAIGELLRN